MSIAEATGEGSSVPSFFYAEISVLAARISTLISGISVLPAPDDTVIHPRAAERTKSGSSPQSSGSERPTLQPALDVEPAGVSDAAPPLETPQEAVQDLHRGWGTPMAAARRSWLSTRTQTAGARMSLSIIKGVTPHLRARVSTTDKGQDPLPLVQLLVLYPVKPVRSTQMNMYDICRSPFCVWPNKFHDFTHSAILKSDLIIEADSTHSITE